MLPRLTLLSCLIAIPALAQDPVDANPGSFKVEIENNYVRVLRSTFAANAKRSVHDQLPSCLVLITDVHERIKRANGTSEELQGRAGDVKWVEGGKFSEENLLPERSEWVVIEMKPERVHDAPVTLDPIKLDPQYHSVVFENDRVRAMRTVLEPHMKGPEHEHPSYVVVYLTGLHTTMKMADGREIDNLRKPGEIAWRDRLKHQTVNIGDKTSVEIQVEMK